MAIQLLFIVKMIKRIFLKCLKKEEQLSVLKLIIEKGVASHNVAIIINLTTEFRFNLVEFCSQVRGVITFFLQVQCSVAQLVVDTSRSASIKVDERV